MLLSLRGEDATVVLRTTDILYSSIKAGPFNGTLSSLNIYLIS